MEYKYGDFSPKQIGDIKTTIRKKIYFLLLLKDPETKDNYRNVDASEAFTGLLYEIDGFNSLMSYPAEVVEVQSLLEEAKKCLEDEEFCFEKYRKLLLDSGAKVSDIKEV